MDRMSAPDKVKQSKRQYLSCAAALLLCEKDVSAEAVQIPACAFLSGLDYAAISVYLIALLIIGAYFTRKNSDTDTFFLGGRKVPWWAVGLSIFGTSISAITYLSIPARAYAGDWVWIVANMGILFIAPAIALWYIPAFRSMPIATAYEYLEVRFNYAMRIYGSLCFAAFQLGRIGIVMLLPAIALSTATGVNVAYCILAMGVLTTIYTAMGGIEAVIWTDVMQSVILVMGAILALIVVILNVDGGAGAIVAEAYAADKFHTFNWTWDYTQEAVWIMVLGNAFSCLYPATADQTIVQRYLSTEDVRAARRAMWTNAWLTIPTSLLFFGLGTALWAFYRHHPELLMPKMKNDAILPLFVMERFPSGLRGVLIAGVFAAAMSSLDSSINSLASVIVNDYYKRLRPRANEARALLLARVATVALGAVGTGAALVAARIDSVSLWDPLLNLLNIVGGGLSGIFALGMFTKRANGRGAIAGAIASAVSVWLARQAGVHMLFHAFIGFWTAFIVGYAASLALPPTKKQIQ